MALTKATYSLIEGAPINVLDYGAVGDGVADDTAAFVAAAAAITAQNGGTLVIPATSAFYIVGSQTFANGPGQGYSYQELNILSFINLTEPVLIRSNGAVIKNKSGLKFGAFSPTTGAPYASTSPFFDFDYRASIGAIFYVEGCASFTIDGSLELDGNISGQTIGGVWGDVGYQCDHMGVQIEACDFVDVSNVYAHHFGLDGFLVGWANMTATTAIKPHTFSDCRSLYNGRQGLSWIGGNNLVLNNFVAAYTGKNGTVQSAPSAGLDIEPESSICSGLRVYGGEFYDNFGVGVVADVAGASDCKFFGTTFVGTTSYALWDSQVGFELHGCVVVGSVLRLRGDATNIDRAAKVYGGLWTMQTSYSPTGVVFNPGSRPWEFVDGPVQIYGVTFNAVTSELPFSPAANAVRYSNCTFKSTGAVTSSTQGIFSGVNLLTISGTWNIIGTLINLGTIYLNGNLYAPKEVSLVLVNGANNDVVIPTPISGDDTVYLNVTGPTGVFNITGIAAPANVSTNQKVQLINVSGQTMTLTYGSGSSSFNNQILIGGSVDLAITTNGTVELTYSIFRPGWYVTGFKS
jgi:hypothetical protein